MDEMELVQTRTHKEQPIAEQEKAEAVVDESRLDQFGVSLAVENDGRRIRSDPVGMNDHQRFPLGVGGERLEHARCVARKDKGLVRNSQLVRSELEGSVVIQRDQSTGRKLQQNVDRGATP